MNKRQYKKYCKKYKQRSYYKVRRKRIIKNIHDKYGSEYNMIHIIDSHRMDLKHPIKITLFKNVYPTSIRGAGWNKYETVEFTASQPDLSENNAVMKALNDWKKGVYNEG